jgi:hypothetical protein
MSVVSATSLLTAATAISRESSVLGVIGDAPAAAEASSAEPSAETAAETAAENAERRAVLAKARLCKLFGLEPSNPLVPDVSVYMFICNSSLTSVLDLVVLSACLCVCSMVEYAHSSSRGALTAGISILG